MLRHFYSTPAVYVASSQAKQQETRCGRRGTIPKRKPRNTKGHGSQARLQELNKLRKGTVENVSDCQHIGLRDCTWVYNGITNTGPPYLTRASCYGLIYQLDARNEISSIRCPYRRWYINPLHPKTSDHTTQISQVKENQRESWNFEVSESRSRATADGLC